MMVVMANKSDQLDITGLPFTMFFLQMTNNIFQPMFVCAGDRGVWIAEQRLPLLASH